MSLVFQGIMYVGAIYLFTEEKNILQIASSKCTHYVVRVFQKLDLDVFNVFMRRAAVFKKKNTKLVVASLPFDSILCLFRSADEISSSAACYGQGLERRLNYLFLLS